MYIFHQFISGCQNSCSRHQINEIGFAGGKRKVGDALEDVFDLDVGGTFSREKTELGKSRNYYNERDS